MPSDSRRRKGEQGIRCRHARSCPAGEGGRCRCSPSWQAQVWSARDGRLIAKTFPTLAAARTWRADTMSAVRQGRRRASRGTTLRAAAGELMEGIDSGAIRGKDGRPYRLSTIRGYRSALELHLVPALGARRLADITPADLRQLVERWQRDGTSAAAIRNQLMPLRVIMNRALLSGELTVSPFAGLRLPQARRRQVEPPEVADTLARLEPLPADARLLFAFAMSSGLRIGEIRALRWGDVDERAGIIRVREALDHATGTRQEPKTAAGVRDVPIIAPLAAELARVPAGSRVPSHYVIAGREPGRPFTATNLRRKARAAWQRAGMEPLTPHECRHVLASYAVGAGLSAVELQALLGHESVTTTMDTYTHLLSGSAAATRRRLDTFFAAADEPARLAALEHHALPEARGKATV
jgi:integrase